MGTRIGSTTLIAAGALLLVAAASVAAGLIAPSQVVWLGLLLFCPPAMFFMMRGMLAGHGDQDRRPVHLAIPIPGSDSREDE